MKDTSIKFQYAICINDGDYVDDLRVGSVYQVLSDELAAKSNYLRIIDETGEDYLYPASYFIPVNLSPETEKILSSVLYSRSSEKKTTNKGSTRKQKVRT